MSNANHENLKVIPLSYYYHFRQHIKFSHLGTIRYENHASFFRIWSWSTRFLSNFGSSLHLHTLICFYFSRLWLMQESKSKLLRLWNFMIMSKFLWLFYDYEIIILGVLFPVFFIFFFRRKQKKMNIFLGHLRRVRINTGNIYKCFFMSRFMN